MNRKIRTRQTTNAQLVVYPVWSPRGTELVVSTQDALPRERFTLTLVPHDRSEKHRVLYAAPDRLEPTDWSRDGRFILFNRGELTSPDMWVLPVAEPAKASPFAQSPHSDRDGQFSPNGRWVAYTSSETGREEVYVRDFPQGGIRTQISGDGGAQPRWGASGRELYYVSTRDDQLIEAVVDTSGRQLSLHSQKPLFRLNMFVGPRSTLVGYDVSPGGDRFLVNSAADAREPRLSLIENWSAILRTR